MHETPSMPHRSFSFRKISSSVTTVTTVTGIPIREEFEPSKYTYNRTPVTSVTSVTKEGQGLIQCQECRVKGKLLFFATDADLATHMRAYHEAEQS